MRVLLVEDDEELGQAVKSGLELAKLDFVVDWLTDGLTALQAIKAEVFDVVVLDLGLPKMSGLNVLQNIRASGLNLPVLILTARDSIEDRINGLDKGADDYLAKPFDLFELAARLRALHRRTLQRAEPLITYLDFVLDPASHSITRAGQELALSRREFALLQKLLENVGHVLSREVLTQCLYGWGEEVDSNTLEVHIHNLRKKLGGEFIRTIRGVGYMVEKGKDELGE